ncbi:MAG: ABC transporter permease [Anaerolineae bacterium]|jgi:ABC-type transport system involved in multi-copper enzyme maturation permease subunit|nr:ABC transporter permease [Anaerolineae bacterium]
MTALFRAEWLKLAGNRWAVTFFVWIFPISALFLSIGAIVIALFTAAGSPENLSDMAQFLTNWQGGFLSAWAFPNSDLGRFTIIIFTAIVFAGEYQHGTWKNLITRRPRWVIMLNKFFTLGVFITIAFVMMSIFVGIGSIVLAQIVGYNMGVFDADTFGKFIRDITSQMALTLVTTFIATGYTALAAMYTKNIIGTIFTSLLITLGEPSVLLLVSLGRSLLSIDLFPLYLLTPTYNFSNIRNAEMGYEAFVPLAPEGFVPFSVTISWLILIGWIVFLVSLSIRNFTSQDITA